MLLPDDKVLVTGGSRYYRGMHGSDNRDTRIYDAATNSFSWAADSITGRDYHSGGILLPNGSVLTLGGNPLYGNKQDTAPQTFNQEIDVYFPPYMFQGTRPRVVSAPRVMELGHSYLIKVTQAAEHPGPAADAARQPDARDRRQPALDRGELHPGRERRAQDHPAVERQPGAAQLLHAVRGQRQRAVRRRATGSGSHDRAGHQRRAAHSAGTQRPWPWQESRPCSAPPPAAQLRARLRTTADRAARLYAYPGNPLFAAAALLSANGHRAEAAELKAIAQTPSGIWAAGQPGDMREVRQVTLAAGEGPRHPGDRRLQPARP